MAGSLAPGAGELEGRGFSSMACASAASSALMASSVCPAAEGTDCCGGPPGMETNLSLPLPAGFPPGKETAFCVLLSADAVCRAIEFRPPPPTSMDFGAAALDKAVAAGADLLGGAKASVSTAAGDVTHRCALTSSPCAGNAVDTGKTREARGAAAL